jgi:Cu2+-exporting ATPase
MKETILQIDGWMSCLDARGIEKKLMVQRGVHHVAANFMSGTATVHYDESQVSLADLKKLVTECGCDCAGESVPDYIVKPSDPPAMERAMHAGHAMPAQPLERGAWRHVLPAPESSLAGSSGEGRNMRQRFRVQK